MSSLVTGTELPAIVAGANLATGTVYQSGQRESTVATFQPNTGGQTVSAPAAASISAPATSLPPLAYLLSTSLSSDPRFSYSGYGTSYVLVQDGPLGWEYYSQGLNEWLPFAPDASDLLVAEVSGGTVTQLVGQSSILDGVQCGYQAASGFNVSITLQSGSYLIQASAASFTPYYVAQTTQYVYGTGAAASPDLYCNDLVTAVLYPDSTGGTDEVQYTYDRQGEMTSMEDQNGTTHVYAYDGVGHLLSDTATVAPGNPGNIDTAVASIDYAYKVCGRLLSVSSENSGGTVLNEDYYQYDSNGNLEAEYQDASGAINPSDLSGIPYVGYGYDDSTTTEEGLTVSTTGFRPTTVEYPTVPGETAARTLTYSYGTSGTNDAINQLDSILDGTTSGGVVTAGGTLDGIGYLGDGTIVSEDYDVPGVGYNLLGTTGGQSNLDQYGRVQDQVWTNSTGMIDGYQYTYSAQGDVASRQNLALDAYKTANPSSTAPYLDEVYGYNAEDGLTSLALRGTEPGGGRPASLGHDRPHAELDARRQRQLDGLHSRAGHGGQPRDGGRSGPDAHGRQRNPQLRQPQRRQHVRLGGAHVRSGRQHDHHAHAGRRIDRPDLHV